VGQALSRLEDRTAWQASNEGAEIAGGTMRSDRKFSSSTEHENHADVSDFVQG